LATVASPCCTSCCCNSGSVGERPSCPCSPNLPLQIDQPHPLRSCQALTCQNWACNGGDTPCFPQPTVAQHAAVPSSQALRFATQPLTALPAPRKCSQWLYHTLISLEQYSQKVNGPTDGEKNHKKSHHHGCEQQKEVLSASVASKKDVPGPAEC